MHGHEVQSRFDDQGRNRPEEDRDFVVIGLMAAAISGFLVGLATRGEFACAVSVAVLVPVTGIATWRLRTAVARGSLELGADAPEPFAGGVACPPIAASDARSFPAEASGRTWRIPQWLRFTRHDSPGMRPRVGSGANPLERRERHTE